MPDIRVGSHDKGWTDATNKIISDGQPIASNLNINEAIEKAKGHAGAELVVVDDTGSAKVVALKVKDSLIKENKTVNISELDRDPAAKQNLAKTPLAIDDNIARAFGGSAAFLVDEKNNVTYLGDDVDKTTKDVTLKDAEKFVKTPNKNKVDAAYVMAKEAGNEKRVEVKLANNVLDDLAINYKDTPPADKAVSLLKKGEVKTKMEDLLINLKSVDKIQTSENDGLKGQLKERTDKWKSDLVEPTKRLNKGNDAWSAASNQENQKVQTSFHNLREAKFPGIYTLEKTLSGAEGERDNAKSNLNSAISQKNSAQNHLSEIESLPGQIQGLRNQNSNLESENRSLATQLLSYLTITRSSVSSELSTKRTMLSRDESELRAEQAKPTKPSSGGGSVTDDPFSNKKSGSVYDDPFSNGSGGNYRDEYKITRLESSIRELRSDISDLDSRESSLSSLSFRVAVDTDISQISGWFYNLNTIDRLALNRFSTQCQENKNEISNNNSAISNKQHSYNNNIGPARENLSDATTNEARAQGVYSAKESRVNQLSADLQNLKASPISDDEPKVKPFFTAHNKALQHQDATVGELAPLTKEKNAAQGVVDGINHDYNVDKRDLENKMKNSSDGAHGKAQGMIKDTRTKL